MADQALIQRALPGMSERWMADVVDQRKGFGQVFIQAQRRCSSTGNLRNFDGVSQPAAKVVRGATGKYLRLPCQTTEGASLHDALAVTLESRARGSLWRRVDASDKRITLISGDRASMEIACHDQI
jgi:hypothetical protein